MIGFHLTIKFLIPRVRNNEWAVSLENTCLMYCLSLGVLPVISYYICLFQYLQWSPYWGLEKISNNHILWDWNSNLFVFVLVPRPVLYVCKNIMIEEETVSKRKGFRKGLEGSFDSQPRTGREEGSLALPLPGCHRIAPPSATVPGPLSGSACSWILDLHLAAFNPETPRQFWIGTGESSWGQHWFRGAVEVRVCVYGGGLHSLGLPPFLFERKPRTPSLLVQAGRHETLNLSVGDLRPTSADSGFLRGWAL